jgi:DNA-directed RNA polymerase subunit RPC12/RpoP
MLLILGYLCQLFAVIDFAGMFFGYDLTGVPWSPLVASGIAWVFFQLAKMNSPERQANHNSEANRLNGKQIAASGILSNTSQRRVNDNIQCPHCGRSIAKANKTCLYCEQEIIPNNKMPKIEFGKKRRCPYCGMSIAKESKTCLYCEQKVIPN